MSLTVGELVGYLDIDDKNYNRKIDQGQRKFSDFGAKIGKAAAAAAVAGAVAIGAFVVDGVKRFSEFQAGMNEVFTLLPGISEQAMGKLTDDTRGFVVEMGIAHDKAVPALYQALSAGVPQDNVFDFMKVAAKAARGGVTELETAVDGITSTVNAYGAEALSAEQASDLMFTAVRLGKTTFGELSASLFQVNPVAAALGVNFGDVTAALAAMTAQGVPTSVATTQLRQAFVEMSKAGGATAKTFEKVAGKSFKDFIAGGGNVQQALQLLEKHAQDTGVGVNDLFGSVEAGAAALALTGGGTKKFSDALTGMQGSAGATDKAYQTMERGLSRSWERIKIAFQDAALSLGKELEPAIASVADWLATKLPGAIKTTGNFLKDVGEVIKAVSGFYKEHQVLINSAAVALGTIVTIIGVVTAVTRTWAAVQTAMNVVLAANPIGLVILVVAGLVAGLIYAYKKSETFRDIVNGAFDAVKKSIGNAVGLMIDGFKMLLTVWLTVADGIVSGAATALGWIPGLGGKLKAANAAFDTMKTGILRTLDDAAQKAYGFGEKSGSNTASGLSKTSPQAVAAAGRMSGAVGTKIRAVEGIAYGAGAAAGQGLVNGLNSKQHSVAAAAQRLAATAGRAMQTGLQVRSPSRLTTYFGEMVGQGLIVGMDSRTTAVAASAGRLASASLPNASGIRLPAGAVRGGDGAGIGGGVQREVVVVRGETNDELALAIADRMDINHRDRMAMANLGAIAIVT
jgi:TP901 family phage tail tape measure protein